MGIETLNSAARAAGFAMAASDEFEDAGGGALATDAQWRPGETALVRETPGERADWIRVVLSLFGRRAPATPA